MTSLIVTVIGPDRPGIVNSLSDTAAAHSANWQESRMANLAGQFAGIFRLEVAEPKLAALERALHKLETAGLKVVIAQSRPTSDDNRRSIAIEIVGNDRPGIVRDISKITSDLNISIEEFESISVSSSMSGDKLFKANAILSIPDALDVDELNERLQDLANDIIVDIELHI